MAKKTLKFASVRYYPSGMVSYYRVTAKGGKSPTPAQASLLEKEFEGLFWRSGPGFWEFTEQKDAMRFAKRLNDLLEQGGIEKEEAAWDMSAPALPRALFLTPSGSLSAKATAQDSPLWYMQTTTLDNLEVSAMVSFSNETEKQKKQREKARARYTEIAGKQAEGWELVRYKAGRLGEVFVFSKDGKLLTKSGFSTEKKEEKQEMPKTSKVPMEWQQLLSLPRVIKALSPWLKTPRNYVSLKALQAALKEESPDFKIEEKNHQVTIISKKMSERLFIDGPKHETRAIEAFLHYLNLLDAAQQKGLTPDVAPLREAAIAQTNACNPPAIKQKGSDVYSDAQWGTGLWFEAGKDYDARALDEASKLFSDAFVKTGGWLLRHSNNELARFFSDYPRVIASGAVSDMARKVKYDKAAPTYEFWCEHFFQVQEEIKGTDQGLRELAKIHWSRENLEKESTQKRLKEIHDSMPWAYEFFRKLADYLVYPYYAHHLAEEFSSASKGYIRQQSDLVSAVMDGKFTFAQIHAIVERDKKKNLEKNRKKHLLRWSRMMELAPKLRKAFPRNVMKPRPAQSFFEENGYEVSFSDNYNFNEMYIRHAEDKELLDAVRFSKTENVQTKDFYDRFIGGILAVSSMIKDATHFHYIEDAVRDALNIGHDQVQRYKEEHGEVNFEKIDFYKCYEAPPADLKDGRYSEERWKEVIKLIPTMDIRSDRFSMYIVQGLLEKSVLSELQYYLSSPFQEEEEIVKAFEDIAKEERDFFLDSLSANRPSHRTAFYWCTAFRRFVSNVRERVEGASYVLNTLTKRRSEESQKSEEEIIRRELQALLHRAPSFLVLGAFRMIAKRIGLDAGDDNSAIVLLNSQETIYELKDKQDRSFSEKEKIAKTLKKEEPQTSSKESSSKEGKVSSMSAKKSSINSSVGKLIRSTRSHSTDDYPYGRHRTEARWSIERNNKGLERIVMQTKNPKTKAWNQPKKTTYADKAMIALDENDRTYYLSSNGSSINVATTAATGQSMGYAYPDDPRYEELHALLYPDQSSKKASQKKVEADVEYEVVPIKTVVYGEDSPASSVLVPSTPEEANKLEEVLDKKDLATEPEISLEEALVGTKAEETEGKTVQVKTKPPKASKKAPAPPTKKSSGKAFALKGKYQFQKGSLDAFLNNMLKSRKFDPEALTALFEHLDLGWKERGEQEVALMKELRPMLTRASKKSEILGLAEYYKLARRAPRKKAEPKQEAQKKEPTKKAAQKKGISKKAKEAGFTEMSPSEVKTATALVEQVSKVVPENSTATVTVGDVEVEVTRFGPEKSTSSPKAKKGGKKATAKTISPTGELFSPVGDAPSLPKQAKKTQAGKKKGPTHRLYDELAKRPASTGWAKGDVKKATKEVDGHTAGETYAGWLKSENGRSLGIFKDRDGDYVLVEAETGLRIHNFGTLTDAQHAGDELLSLGISEELVRRIKEFYYYRVDSQDVLDLMGQADPTDPASILETLRVARVPCRICQRELVRTEGASKSFVVGTIKNLNDYDNVAERQALIEEAQKKADQLDMFTANPKVVPFSPVVSPSFLADSRETLNAELAINSDLQQRLHVLKKEKTAKGKQTKAAKKKEGELREQAKKEIKRIRLALLNKVVGEQERIILLVKTIASDFGVLAYPLNLQKEIVSKLIYAQEAEKPTKEEKRLITRAAFYRHIGESLTMTWRISDESANDGTPLLEIMKAFLEKGFATNFGQSPLLAWACVASDHDWNFTLTSWKTAFRELKSYLPPPIEKKARPSKLHAPKFEGKKGDLLLWVIGNHEGAFTKQQEILLLADAALKGGKKEEQVFANSGGLTIYRELVDMPSGSAKNVSRALIRMIVATQRGASPNKLSRKAYARDEDFITSTLSDLNATKEDLQEVIKAVGSKAANLKAAASVPHVALRYHLHRIDRALLAEPEHLNLQKIYPDHHPLKKILKDDYKKALKSRKSAELFLSLKAAMAELYDAEIPNGPFVAPENEDFLDASKYRKKAPKKAASKPEAAAPKKETKPKAAEPKKETKPKAPAKKAPAKPKAQKQSKAKEAGFTEMSASEVKAATALVEQVSKVVPENSTATVTVGDVEVEVTRFGPEENAAPKTADFWGDALEKGKGISSDLDLIPPSKPKRGDKSLADLNAEYLQYIDHLKRFVEAMNRQLREAKKVASESKNPTQATLAASVVKELPAKIKQVRKYLKDATSEYAEFREMITHAPKKAASPKKAAAKPKAAAPKKASPKKAALERARIEFNLVAEYISGRTTLAEKLKAASLEQVREWAQKERVMKKAASKNKSKEDLIEAMLQFAEKKARAGDVFLTYQTDKSAAAKPNKAAPKKAAPKKYGVEEQNRWSKEGFPADFLKEQEDLHRLIVKSFDAQLPSIWTELKRRVEAANSREEAEKVLKKALILKPYYELLAKYLDIPTAGDSKEKILEKLVQNIVGYKWRSEANRGTKKKVK